jgi:hypothetical protein
MKFTALQKKLQIIDSLAFFMDTTMDEVYPSNSYKRNGISNSDLS